MIHLNLVTGANGHLGNNLVRALLERGEGVRASVRNPNNRIPFEGLDCEIVQADLMDKNSLLRALEGVDTLYQVATGMIAAAKKGRRGERYLLVTEEPMRTQQIIELVRERNPDIKMPPRVPKFLLQSMSSGMEFVSKFTGKQPMLLRSQVELLYDVAARKDISKARVELGFNPRDPETAIREAFDYLANRVPSQ